jgi:hypothetical protein
MDELNPRITFSSVSGKLLANAFVINIRIQPSAGAEFRNQRSKLLFDQLVGAFVSDTVKMKILLESAGWRSLSEPAHSMRVSPSVL